jgi:hypothetical protein
MTNNLPEPDFYDEVAKTSTPEMKQEIMELSQIVQSYAMEKQSE